MSTFKPDLLQRQLDAERRLVSFDSYDLSVRQVLDMLDEGSIFVPPEYQRQFIWREDRQSALIESIFLGIPVPSLYLATNPDASWEVVDGVQRISSLAHFVATSRLLDRVVRTSPLAITGLTKLDGLNGVRFEDLPKSLQVHFTTRPIRLTVLNDKSDLTVRFDLFERLNTGGVALTDQEIRNCVYRGPFNDQLKKLATTREFTSVVKLGDKPEGGAHEELVLRFFAYLDKFEEFDHLVKDFLNKYMEVNRNSPLSAEKIRLFKKTFTFLSQALPHGIVRNRAKTPVNLYEAIAVGVALAFREGASPRAAKVASLLGNETLKRLTGAGSNQKRLVLGRINLVRTESV